MSGNEFLFFEEIFNYSPMNPSNTFSVSPESVTDPLSSHLIIKSPPSKTILFSFALLFKIDAATEFMWALAAVIGCFVMVLGPSFIIYWAAQAKQKKLDVKLEAAKSSLEQE